jgi:hypothetical protein
VSLLDERHAFPDCELREAGKGGGGGWSYAVYDRDPTDSTFANLNQNTFASGTPGTGGSPDGTDGQSGPRNWQ